MKTYIEYGWSEGKWHGRLLTKTLRAFGYTMAVSPNEADVIIAHSAGCYYDFIRLQGQNYITRRLTELAKQTNL